MSNRIYSQFTELLLEVEVRPNLAEKFINQYAEITGLRVAPNENFLIQPNKWGRELRIYFDADVMTVQTLVALGYKVEKRFARHPEYQYRINNQGLFWDLVHYGYRLGINNRIQPAINNCKK